MAVAARTPFPFFCSPLLLFTVFTSGVRLELRLAECSQRQRPPAVNETRRLVYNLPEMTPLPHRSQHCPFTKPLLCRGHTAAGLLHALLLVTSLLLEQEPTPTTNRSI